MRVTAQAEVTEVAIRLSTTPLLPDVGTLHHLRRAHSPGFRSVRVTTHCTEAGISAQHLAAAHGLGMDVAGFLMMSHWPNPPNWPARPS
jgi:4-hydroxy 2-oxovalerate aldolase